MKPNNKEKIYIYNRENKKCFYCHKSLNFNQLSIDHFYPLSKGGTDDIFNIVCSCKKCNKVKKDLKYFNYEKILLALFKKAVKDNQILGENLDIDNKKLKKLLLKVNNLKIISSQFIFESKKYRFYIKDNKVVKYVYVFSI